ncbi:MULTISPECIES: tetratricopeptide repeat protein [Myroides]|uniref:Tetratricopeptide repeat protein n=1 Tax=Myroides albus TaxID=2562892 RepID=A0A6I3LJT1_9FLAO|nr:MULTISPECIES: tetratricopeptide repeat protein [Myroides]MTG98097.1 hypothetical protein [Myroides albus]MVX36265.1 hypothetical protein [Myroides sp. LoEW2-1]UVD80722.1 hypothetical protein NWE55_05610 [Myroides albus]
MNKEKINIALINSTLIEADDLQSFEEVLEEYPYFQSIRTLHLKCLYQNKSERYNTNLKKTAAHTLDRDILFEFITSDSFINYPISIENDAIEKESDITLPIPEEENIESQNTSVAVEKDAILSTETEQKTGDDNEDLSPSETQTTDLPIEVEKAGQTKVEQLEDKLEIGKPLTITENEKYSYEEWLKISSFPPIDREKESILTENEKKLEEERRKKLTLIDRFIETNPKIVPTKKATISPANIETSVQENTSLMTETLAKIYLEQKKYQKAIQAYEILILKYPEKSSFFADQILDIKALQQHNSL